MLHGAIRQSQQTAVYLRKVLRAKVAKTLVMSERFRSHQKLAAPLRQRLTTMYVTVAARVLAFVRQMLLRLLMPRPLQTLKIVKD